MDSKSLIAYFSMEIALEPAIPTYSGGLGILDLTATRDAKRGTVTASVSLATFVVRAKTATAAAPAVPTGGSTS